MCSASFPPLLFDERYTCSFLKVPAPTSVCVQFVLIWSVWCVVSFHMFPMVQQCVYSCYSYMQTTAVTTWAWLCQHFFFLLLLQDCSSYFFTR